MKTKNVIIFIILGIIGIVTTFGVSIMSNFVCGVLLLTWLMAAAVSTKWFSGRLRYDLIYRTWPSHVWTIMNAPIYMIWGLQLITIGIFWDEIDSHIPIGYRLPLSCIVLWGIITTAVILAIMYSVNRWRKNEGESIISIITMIVSGTMGLIIMIFCTGLLDDLAKESLYLLLAITAVEWIILAVTLYSRMKILSLKKTKINK